MKGKWVVFVTLVLVFSFIEIACSESSGAEQKNVIKLSPKTISNSAELSGSENVIKLSNNLNSKINLNTVSKNSSNVIKLNPKTSLTENTINLSLKTDSGNVKQEPKKILESNSTNKIVKNNDKNSYVQKQNTAFTKKGSLIATPKGPDVGWCQPGFCDNGISESNEGPGGDHCCKVESTTSTGYEECTDYQTKSTAYVPPSILNPSKSKTDTCKNAETLIEYYVDCEAFSQDDILSLEKDCNELNAYSAWQYYCTSSEVRKKRTYVDFGCSAGVCKPASVTVDDQLISKKGDDNYCSERKSSGCSLCGRGDYDCDWDSECSSSLICMGLIGGALDGCCKSGETWDTTRYECCECSSGSCCDGCHYKSSNDVCDSHVSGSDQYKCEGNCLDQDVLHRYQKQYCYGSSSSCTGTKEYVQHNEQNCISPQFCSGSTSWSVTIPTCKNAQCTSGDCCNTGCGVYNYRPTSYVCINDLTWYGCQWGNALGSDVGKKIGDRYCNGYASSCNGNFVWGPWTVKQDCSIAQYCGGVEGPEEFWCTQIACSSNSDCGSDYWYGLKCQDNDVYGTFVAYKCNNLGTKESSCTSSDTFKKKQDCGESGWVGEPVCNELGQIYQNYANRGCDNGACFENTEPKLVKICQQGCAEDGKHCKEDTCTDDCSSGQARCSGNYKQSCGNYDADSCLDWGGDALCQYGCSNGNCLSACSDGTLYNSCSTTKPKYCDNGNLINKCTTCGCPSGQSCNSTTNACYIPPLSCSDGTKYGICSTTKPKYCDNGNLINKCQTCGCSLGTCQADGSCQSVCTPGEKRCSGNSAETCKSDETGWLVSQSCASSYCGGWSVGEYCHNGDVYRARVCYDAGCSLGQCYKIMNIEEELINSTTITLKAGNNVFSLPRNKKVSFNQLNTDCKVVVENGRADLAYYIPSGNNISSLNYRFIGLGGILYPGQGYFVKVEKDCYIEMNGPAVKIGDIDYLDSGQLKAGWNLIGATTCRSKSFDKGTCQLYDNLGILKYAYNVYSCKEVSGWNGGYAYCDIENGIKKCRCAVNSFEPGFGYWLKTGNNCNLA